MTDPLLKQIRERFACLLCGCKTGSPLQSHNCIVYLKDRLTALDGLVNELPKVSSCSVHPVGRGTSFAVYGIRSGESPSYDTSQSNHIATFKLRQHADTLAALLRWRQKQPFKEAP